MSPHIESLLDAYVDGELNTAQRNACEAHLRDCAECRGMVAERRAISALLQTARVEEAGKSEQRFLAEVFLQMPRRTVAPKQPNLIRLGWQSIPLILIFGWIFLQAMNFIGTIVTIIPGVGDILLPAQSAGGTAFSFPFDWLAGEVSNFSLLGWNALTQIFLLVVIAGLYLSWMAGWWALQESEEKIGNK